MHHHVSQPIHVLLTEPVVARALVVPVSGRAVDLHLAQPRGAAGGHTETRTRESGVWNACVSEPPGTGAAGELVAAVARVEVWLVQMTVTIGRIGMQGGERARIEAKG